MQAWTSVVIEPFVIGSVSGNISGDTNNATLVSSGTASPWKISSTSVGRNSAGVDFFISPPAPRVRQVDVTFGDDLSGIGGRRPVYAWPGWTLLLPVGEVRPKLLRRG